MSSDSSFVDYYELLGVATDAEPAQIRLAFLQLAKEHHPDVGGSTEQMQQFSSAYRTLMSVTSRKSYDMLHDFHTGSTKAQYRDYGQVKGTATDDLSDDELDDFIDQIFSEYHAQEKSKKSLFTRFKNRL